MHPFDRLGDVPGSAAQIQTTLARTQTRLSCNELLPVAVQSKGDEIVETVVLFRDLVKLLLKVSRLFFRLWETVVHEKKSIEFAPIFTPSLPPEVEGISGGNAVRIIMNGDGELKKIFLDESLYKEKKEILEDLIIAAHNDAKLKLKKKTSDEISKITGGISLPPGFKFPI